MNDLPALIGVCGRAYSGKDTLAEHLVAEYGYRRVAFADKVKEAVYALNPWVALDNIYPALGVYRLQELTAEYEGDDPVTLVNHVKHYDEVRRLLQGMGNEVGQGVFGKHFWVELVLRQIQPGEMIVISDVRYPHEADAIREVGGCVIRVTRPSQPSIGNHPSEALVDECKVQVDVVNDSTIAEYVSNAVEALRDC